MGRDYAEASDLQQRAKDSVERPYSQITFATLVGGSEQSRIWMFHGVDPTAAVVIEGPVDVCPSIEEGPVDAGVQASLRLLPKLVMTGAPSSSKTVTTCWSAAPTMTGAERTLSLRCSPDMF